MKFRSLGKTGTKKPGRQRFFYWTMALMGDPFKTITAATAAWWTKVEHWLRCQNLIAV